MKEFVFNVFNEVEKGHRWVRVGDEKHRTYQVYAKSKSGLEKVYWPEDVPFEDMTINQALKKNENFVLFNPAFPFVDAVFERLGNYTLYNRFLKCPASIFKNGNAYVGVRSKDAVMMCVYSSWHQAGFVFAQLRRLELNVYMGACAAFSEWMRDFVDWSK